VSGLTSTLYCLPFTVREIIEGPPEANLPQLSALSKT